MHVVRLRESESERNGTMGGNDGVRNQVLTVVRGEAGRS